MVPGDRLLFMDISTRRFHGIGRRRLSRDGRPGDLANRGGDKVKYGRREWFGYDLRLCSTDGIESPEKVDRWIRDARKRQGYSAQPSIVALQKPDAERVTRALCNLRGIEFASLDIWEENLRTEERSRLIRERAAERRRVAAKRKRVELPKWVKDEMRRIGKTGR